MKILVMSSTPWNNDNSFGNTFSNFFEGMEDIQIANVFCRPGEPDNSVVDRYFQMTEKTLIGNLKNKNVPSGAVIEKNPGKSVKLNETEQKQFNVARTKRWQILFWLRDLIWCVGRWKSDELKKFVDDFNPDIIFQPIYFSPYLCDIALFLKKYANVPMVGYVSDDCYTLKQFSLSPLFWLDRLFVRKKVKKLFLSCDMVYTISDIQKNEYSKIFKKNCKILTKSLDFGEKSEFTNEYHTPLRMIYAGNLGAGRWKTIAGVFEAIKKINKDATKIILDIYSATPVTDKIKSSISDGINSSFQGQVSASKVLELNKNSDILVHIEGFDIKSRLKVRQSFSTKLVDFFRLAKPIFAVGPDSVASIDYLIKNDSAIVATSAEEILPKLEQLTHNTEILNEYSKKSYECGRKNHSRDKMQKMLLDDLNSLL